jgi:PEP-CTERM motif
MRTFTKLLAASAAAVSLAAVASTASATVLISLDGSTTAATFVDGPYDFTAACTPLVCGGFAGIRVTGATDALPTLLHSATVDATTAAGSAADITIYVTRTGITSPDYNLLGSSFTSNNTPLFGASTPFTVTMSTYISTTDADFGGTLLSTYTSSATGATSSNQVASVSLGSGPYSVTEEYTINAAAFGSTESSSPSIILGGVAVPEPTTWALMIMGFGGVGAMVRGRRRQAVTA